MKKAELLLGLANQAKRQDYIRQRSKPQSGDTSSTDLGQFVGYDATTNRAAVRLRSGTIVEARMQTTGATVPGQKVLVQRQGLTKFIVGMPATQSFN